METCKLIYDAECPLCKAYTSAFRQHGLLKEEERISFQEAETGGMLRQLDMRRSRHTIPFVNTATGEVIYGIDALGSILGRRWPWVERTVQHPVVHRLLVGLYNFISYNRRVIPIIPRKPGAVYYGPDLHRGYRMAYMFLVAVVSVIISYRLGQHAGAEFPSGPLNGYTMVWAVSLGWINHLLFSCLMLRGQDRWEYTGHLFTIMLLGVLALTPYLLLGSLVVLPAWAGRAAILFSLSLMCHQHIQRLKALRLPRYYFFCWLASLLLFFLITSLILH